MEIVIQNIQNILIHLLLIGQAFKCTGGLFLSRHSDNDAPIL
jgi:hypothetical protein